MGLAPTKEAVTSKKSVPNVHTTILLKLYFLGVQYIVSNILIVLTAQMEIEPYSVLEIEKKYI